MEETEKLKKAAAWCRKEFAERYEENEHSSFLVAEVLEEAIKKFDLRCYGVEGWAYGVGASGVHYLNYGDPYEPTIVARAHPREARINYSSEGWSTLVRE